MRKKSQFEIIGLVFIVAIISVALVLVLVLSAGQKKDSPRQTFTDKTFAQDTLIVMSKITLPCKLTSSQSLFLDELVADCARGSTIFCDSVDMDSCNYSKAVIYNVLNASLETYKRPYMISSTQIDLYKSYLGCTKDKDGHQAILPIPLGGGSSVTITLRICG